jgi:deoxyribodipyrimidine photolyase-like uncharacterized protein
MRLSAFSGIQIPMEEELANFEEILCSASTHVSEQYFQLPVADADTIYRERVYCYELYHQMRRRWGNFPFSLGGEIDKGGHPRFQNGPYAGVKPDYLVHVPGEMHNNLACVEVKPVTRPVAEFIADLQKLTWFCQNANYFRGLFLVYGDVQGGGGAALQDKLRRALPNAANIDLNVIHIFLHPAVLRRSERILI